MGFVYIISQVRLMKVYLELLLVKCLALWLNFSPLGSKIFPCKVLARECLPSTSPRYLEVVGQAGSIPILHRRKPKLRGNTSFAQSHRVSAARPILASMTLVSWSMALLTVLRI